MNSFLLLSGVDTVLVSDPDSPYYEQTGKISHVFGHSIFVYIEDELVEFEDAQLTPIV